jgi:hypothetical protein
MSQQKRTFIASSGNQILAPGLTGNRTPTRCEQRMDHASELRKQLAARVQHGRQAGFILPKMGAMKISAGSNARIIAISRIRAGWPRNSLKERAFFARALR